MFYFMILALAATFAQSAPANVPVLKSEEVQAFVLAGFKKQEQAAKAIKGQSDEQLTAALTTSLSGRTKLIFQPGHGVYAEYTAPDGQLRMWYPRNVAVVKGSWGVRKVKGAIRVCFQYSQAINPVTHVYEPTECVKPVQTLSDANVLQSWPGDPFGLMGDRIPYRKGSLDMPSPEMISAQPQ